MTLRYNLRTGQSTYRNSDPVSADTAIMCIYSHIKNRGNIRTLIKRHPGKVHYSFVMFTRRLTNFPDWHVQQSYIYVTESQIQGQSLHPVFLRPRCIPEPG